jgi:prevent-host-death family protein
VKTVNASNARKSFARVLASVVKDDEPVIIVRYSQPIAALVPISRLHPSERVTLKNGRGVTDGVDRRRG